MSLIPYDQSYRYATAAEVRSWEKGPRKSKKRSRKMPRCKYGKLKSKIGRRVCKKRSIIGRRKHARRGSKVCRFGKLKNPTGKRVCKKRRGGRSRRASQEAAMWRAYRAG